MKNKQTKDDGIYLSSHIGHEMDMALISLKIGFEAYFSTYQAIKRSFARLVEPPRKKLHIKVEKYEEKDEESDKAWRHVSELNYTKAYIQTIFHFHHFIEVSIKEILRQQHPLLAVLTGKQHVILHKLLMGEEVPENESEGLNTIDFWESVERLKKLIDEKRIKNYEDMKFISEAGTKNGILKEIGGYRNRLVHRGTFMLSYTELDKFIGKDILPLVLKISSLPIYKDSEYHWQPKKLHCKMNLLDEIKEECKKTKLDFHKIAFLKEMGRASFVNPLWTEDMNSWFAWAGGKEKEHIEEQAVNSREYQCDMCNIEICPVCGAKSLMQYYENMSPDPDEEDMGIYGITCLCCSFSVDHQLDNVEFEDFDVKKLWEMP